MDPNSTPDQETGPVFNLDFEEAGSEDFGSHEPPLPEEVGPENPELRPDPDMPPLSGGAVASDPAREKGDRSNVMPPAHAQRLARATSDHRTKARAHPASAQVTIIAADQAPTERLTSPQAITQALIRPAQGVAPIDMPERVQIRITQARRAPQHPVNVTAFAALTKTGLVGGPSEPARDGSRLKGLGESLPVAAIGATSGISDAQGATAPIARSTPAAIANPAAIVRQLSDLAARANGDVIEVTLDPPELGKLRFAMSGKSGVMTVAIQSDVMATLDLLRRHQDMLRADFLDQGYEEVTFSFDQGRQETEGEPATQSESLVDESIPLAEEATESQAQQHPVSGVDIRV